MRVLALNWRDLTHPEAGGAEENIHELGKRMVQQGHEFSLFCARYPGAPKEEVLEGVRVFRMGGRFTVYLAAPLFYLTRGRLLRPDVIIDDINGIPFFTPLFTGRPKLALFHHRVGEIFKEELPFPLSQVGMFMESHMLPLVYSRTQMMTVSDSSRSELIAMGLDEDRIQVSYNGIRLNGGAPDPGAKDADPSVCYMGRLKRYKRLDILLRAALDLSAEFPTLKVRLAGKGDDSRRLEDLAHELGVSDRVEFLGFVTEEEKVALLRRSWVFAMPSEKEGWGITSVEASACGTPVVAFRVPGLRDSVSDGRSGLLVEDERGFKEALALVLRDWRLRARLSKGAREWAARFNWDDYTARTIDILDRVRATRS